MLGKNIRYSENFNFLIFFLVFCRHCGSVDKDIQLECYLPTAIWLSSLQLEFLIAKGVDCITMTTRVAFGEIPKLLMREFDERFLISFNTIAFRGKMSFTYLASLPRPTLIDQVLTPCDLWCKDLLSFSSWSTRAEIFLSIDTPIVVLYFSVIEELWWWNMMMTIFIQWYFWFTSHTLFSDSRSPNRSRNLFVQGAIIRDLHPWLLLVLFVHWSFYGFPVVQWESMIVDESA